MRIQYVSDIHLDSSNISRIEKSGDVLVVAGDVSYEDGLLFDFFERKVPIDIPVLFVPGNHEYECREVSTHSFKPLLASLSHVHVLENEAIELNDVLFVGSTLWSDFEGAGVELFSEAMASAQLINDFKTLRCNGQRWTPQGMAQASKQAQVLVSGLLRGSTARRKVLITHYAPHRGSVADVYKKNGRVGPDSAYWVNHLPELLALCDVCIHGHVHDSFDYKVGSTRVVCNPRGYSRLYDQAENGFFDRTKAVEI